MLSAKKLLLLVALVYLVKTAASCSCLQGHPQTAYCNGALAFGFDVMGKDRVNVTTNLESSGGGSDDLIQPPATYQREMIRYVAFRFTLYQGNEKFNYSSSIRFIYTSGDSASCGANLSVFRRYFVIGGDYSDNRLEITSCSHIIDKDQLDLSQRQILAWNMAYGFKKGCKCTVRDCNFDKCEDPRPKNECYTKDLNGHGLQYSQTNCMPFYFGATMHCIWRNGYMGLPPKPIKF